MKERALVMAAALAVLCVSTGLGQPPPVNVFELGRMNWDEEIATQCIQGIANRNGAELYLKASNHEAVYGPYYSHLWAGADTAWMNFYHDYKSVTFRTTPIPDLDSLVKHYKTQLNSQLVVYDPKIETEDMVAATYAGINTCLPVTPAMKARLTPGMRAVYGWVDENMGADVFQKVFAVPGPPPDTIFGQQPQNSITIKGGDFLELAKNSSTSWIGAWLNGVVIDCATYPYLAIRVNKDTLNGAVIVKLKAPWSPEPLVFPTINNNGIYFLSIPDSFRQKGVVEFERLEINLWGPGAVRRAEVDWVISCRSNDLSTRVRKNLLDEEGSTITLWDSNTGGTTLTNITFRDADSTQALKGKNSSGLYFGWIRTQNCTLNVSKFSRIVIRIDSCDGQWGLDVRQSGGNWTTLQSARSDTGTFRYAWPYGWSGEKYVDIRVNVNMKNKKVVLNSLRAIALPLDSIGWTVSKSYVDSFSTRFQAQQAAYNSLFPQRQKDIGLNGNAGLSTYLGLDYVVGKKGYAFRVDNWRESPDNEKALFNNVVYGLSRGDSCAPIYGYLDDTGYKNVNNIGNSEYEYVKAITQNGGYMMCTPAQNLSFHNQFTGSWQPQTHTTDTLHTQKVYVALMLSEGDTPKFAFSFFGGSWKKDSPQRGTIPFNWGINPVFAELCPAVLQYYYNTRTTNDYFFAGSSGVGYTLPVWFDANHLTNYATKFKTAGQSADICISDIWMADESIWDTIPPNYATPKLRTYAQTADNAKGFTVMQDHLHGDFEPKGRVTLVRDSVPAVCVYRNLHYWVTYFDSIAYNRGWNRADSSDTNRCGGTFEAAWDTIGSPSLRAGKWQSVLANRLWEEYVRNGQQTPMFTAIFSAPKPDTQAVTFAKGVIDSANAIATRNGKTGLFKFVTLYEMMDAIKHAPNPFTGTVKINDDAKFTNNPNVTLKLTASIKYGQPEYMKFWDADSSDETWKPYSTNPQQWHFHDESNGVKWVYARFKSGTNILSDTARDSIILDASAPFASIYSPVDSQVVGGSAIPFVGYARDWEGHLSHWEIKDDGDLWTSGDTTIGGHPWFEAPGLFGNWNGDSAGYTWHTHVLTIQDSATNYAYDTVHVVVVEPSGDGDGFAAGFGSFSSSPVNVATDKKGNLIVAETQGSTLRAFSSKKDTLFSFSARRGNDTSGVTWPAAMSLKDSTDLWIADGLNDCIKKFDRQGNLLLRFGSHGSDSGHFNQPCGIALDWKGRIWITDRLNHRIQVYDTTGTFLFGFGGQGQDSGKLNSPTGIAITQNKRVWVSDTKNNQVQVFDSLGNWVKTFKQPDTLGFDTPTGICVDRHGDIFIADTKHHRIVELNPFGRRLFIFGSQGDSLCQFRNPIGVTSSPGGHFLYVADMGNRRVQRFTVIRGDTLGGGGPQGRETLRLPPKVNFMSQSYPNPTTGEAVIEYGLAKESPVTLTIYNVAGQVVREYNPGKQKAWYYSITWDGRSNLGHRVGAGVYFYRLQAGNWVKTRKMVVIR